MLDFYFISDEKPNSYSPAKAEYAGGINIREFEQAQYACIIESYLDFFKDFRWSCTRVKQKLTMIQGIKSEKFNALQDIVQRAVERNCGVITFGD